jgi:hypothetical protein
MVGWFHGKAEIPWKKAVHFLAEGVGGQRQDIPFRDILPETYFFQPDCISSQPIQRVGGFGSSVRAPA